MMEQAPAGPPQEAAQSLPEQRPTAVPERPSIQLAGGQAAPLNLPMPPLPPPPAQNDVTTTTQLSSPPLADDGDLIEKEWVDKAKKIVERNREDPYTQSEELTVVKADYMKQRYNKVIKVDK